MTTEKQPARPVCVECDGDGLQPLSGAPCPRCDPPEGYQAPPAGAATAAESSEKEKTARKAPRVVLDAKTATGGPAIAAGGRSALQGDARAVPEGGGGYRQPGKRDGAQEAAGDAENARKAGAGARAFPSSARNVSAGERASAGGRLGASGRAGAGAGAGERASERERAGASGVGGHTTSLAGRALSRGARGNAHDEGCDDSGDDKQAKASRNRKGCDEAAHFRCLC